MEKAALLNQWGWNNLSEKDQVRTSSLKDNFQA